MAGLKSYLREEKAEAFGRALTARLASYAVGRSLELTDEETIDDLSAEFVANDYRLRDLISRIVRSELFLTK